MRCGLRGDGGGMRNTSPASLLSLAVVSVAVSYALVAVPPLSEGGGGVAVMGGAVAFSVSNIVGEALGTSPDIFAADCGSCCCFPAASLPPFAPALSFGFGLDSPVAF